MRESLFWDTSAIYAYINRKDTAHEPVKRAVSGIRGKLIISNYIFDEIVTLVSSRLGHTAAVHIGNVLINSPQVERSWVSSQDELNAWILFAERSDKQYSFTDCASFILMRRLGVKKCLALDDHFRQEGFDSCVC